MADGPSEDGETSLGTLLVSRSVSPPGSPVKFTKSGKTLRIPLTRIRCGKWDLYKEERYLEYQSTTTKLVVIFRDRQHFEHQECIVFNLLDISAADLRVTAKFGSLDAMSGILTLECDQPIGISGSDRNLEYKTHVIEITFHVNYTGQVRDILRSLRQAKLSEDFPEVSHSSTNIEQFHDTFREGLPDWVLLIPRRLYTPFTRRTVETILTFYTIFSILWALWQLYRHVDFIRAYVRPVIDALISQIRTLDKLIQVANSLLEKFTQQWLSYFKPVCVILTSFATPLISLGRHIIVALLNVYTIFKVTFQPLVNVLMPCVNLLYTVFIKAPFNVLRQIYDVFQAVFIIVYETLYTTQVAHLIRTFSQTMGEIIERSMRLDPLKAQLILMRSNVLNSGKALCHGFVYIYKSIERRVWYVFWRTTEEKED